MRRGLAALLLVLCCGAVLDAAAAKITLLMPAGDPRLERARIERAFPGHPGGPAALKTQRLGGHGFRAVAGLGATVSTFGPYSLMPLGAAVTARVPAAR